MTTKTEAGSAPVRTYDDHAALLSRMDSNVAGWRGCAGVALIVKGDVVPPEGQAGDQGFIRNDDLTWVTAVDIPVPWMTGLSRTAHMVQVRRPVLRYGAPLLCPSGVLKEFDYWDGPTRHPDLDPQVRLAADGLNNAMTSTAFAFRSAWGPHNALYRAWAGVDGKPAVILGSKKYDPVVVKDFGWVPKPWVSVDPRKAATMFGRLKEGDFNDTFKAVVIDLFAAGMPVTSPVHGIFTGTSPLVVSGVRYTQFNFREANGARQAVVATGGATVSSQKGMRVFRGTQVGSDVPPVPRGFYSWPRARQWGAVVQAYRPEVFDLVLGNVFSAMFRQAGSVWLLPFAVLGQDVSYALGTGELWWDVSPIFGNDRDFTCAEDPNVHIMPTMRMGQWDSFKDHLGHTAVDLTPVDSRFRSFALGRQIRRKFPMTADGYSGDAQGEIVPVAVVPGKPLEVLPQLGDDALAEYVAATETPAEWDFARKSAAATSAPALPVEPSAMLEHGVTEAEMSEERWEDDGGPPPPEEEVENGSRA